MTLRTEQVASTLQRALQEVLARGLKDPRISGLLTVMSVTVSDDLRTATVGVSIFPEDRENLTMHGLAAAAPHIRHEVSNKVALRRMPELVFKLDRTLKKQAEVFAALAKVARERESQAGQAGPESDASP